ncbi:MAG: serine hydrolase domain-containing protein [Pseudomonadota bacterium]
MLDETKQRFGIVGYSAVILRNGETIHTRSDGLASIELNAPVTEETVFQVFSVAKLFVHTTIMQLHENGAIDLDAGIGHYLTDLPEAWRDITVRQLLSHESGLPDYYRWPDHQTPKDAEEALALAETLPSFFPTGTSARYTQTNYLLLGLLIEQQTGEPFRAAMASRMMEPSSLKNTAYGGEFAVIPGRATMYRSTEDGVRRNLFIDQPDYMFASTGLNSTASDLAKWFQHLLAGEFLSPSTLDAMWTPLDSEDGRKPRFLNGWEYTKCKDGTVVVGHGGGNRADVRHFTRGDESVTIVFLSNGSAVDFWPGQISFDLAEIVFADE